MMRRMKQAAMMWGVLSLGSAVVLGGCNSRSTESEAPNPARSAQKQDSTLDPAAIQAGQSRSVSAIQNNRNLSDEQKKRMADAISGKVR
jgi:ABC-type oligopeptide transport system substrate-binding subunit